MTSLFRCSLLLGTFLGIVGCGDAVDVIPGGSGGGGSPIPTAKCTSKPTTLGLSGFAGLVPTHGEKLTLAAINKDSLSLNADSIPGFAYIFVWAGSTPLPFVVGEKLTTVVRSEYAGVENAKALVLSRYAFARGEKSVPLANLPEGPSFTSELACVNQVSCCGANVEQPTHTLVASFAGATVKISPYETVRLGPWAITNVAQHEGASCKLGCETHLGVGASGVLAVFTK